MSSVVYDVAKKDETKARVIKLLSDNEIEAKELAEKLNDFFKKCYDDGSLMELAEKYNIKDTMIAW